MCIITEKLISLFIRSSVLACEYDTVTNTICLSCLTIALSATKKLGPDKKRFNAMAAIYGIIENVTPAFPTKTTGQQSERRMTLSGVVLLVLSLRAPGAKKKKKRHLTIVSAAVILLRFFKWKTVFSLYVFDTNIETRLLFSSSSDVSPALRARLHSAAVRQLSARHTPNGNLFGRFSSGARSATRSAS